MRSVRLVILCTYIPVCLEVLIKDLKIHTLWFPKESVVLWTRSSKSIIKKTTDTRQIRKSLKVFERSIEQERMQKKTTRPIWSRQVQRQHLSVWHGFYGIRNSSLMTLTIAQHWPVSSTISIGVFKKKAFALSNPSERVFWAQKSWSCWSSSQNCAFHLLRPSLLKKGHLFQLKVF